MSGAPNAETPGSGDDSGDGLSEVLLAAGYGLRRLGEDQFAAAQRPISATALSISVSEPEVMSDGTIRGAIVIAVSGGSITSVTSPDLIATATRDTYTTPKSGTLVYQWDTGQFVYTPSRHAQASGPMDDSFTVVAADNSGNTLSRTVSLPVQGKPANNAPRVILGSQSTAENGTVTGSITFTDDDSDAIAVNSTQLVGTATPGVYTTPTSGTFTFDWATGVYSYVPREQSARSSISAENLEVTVTDAFGASTTQTLTLPIKHLAINTAPQVTATAPVRSADGTLTGTMAFVDQDGDPISVTSPDLTPTSTADTYTTTNGGVFLYDWSTGRYSYTAPTHTDSNETLRFVLTDGHGGTTQHDLTLAQETHHALIDNDAPVTMRSDTATGVVSGTINLSATASGATFRVASYPPMGAGTIKMDVETGSWIFRPSTSAVFAALAGGGKPSTLPSTVPFTVDVVLGNLKETISFEIPIEILPAAAEEIIAKNGQRADIISRDESGGLYLLDRTSKIVTYITSLGEKQRIVLSSFDPFDLAVSRLDGQIWMMDPARGTLRSGSIVNGVFRESFSARQLSVGSRLLFVDSQGNGLITAGNSVTVVDRYGNTLRSFATPFNPTSATETTDGTYVLVDRISRAAALVHSEFAVFPVFLGPQRPTDVVAGDDGSIYFFDTDAGTATRYKDTSKDGSAFTLSAQASLAKTLHDFAFAEGQLYAIDTNRIVKISDDLQTVTTLATVDSPAHMSIGRDSVAVSKRETMEVSRIDLRGNGAPVSTFDGATRILTIEKLNNNSFVLKNTVSGRVITVSSSDIANSYDLTSRQYVSTGSWGFTPPKVTPAGNLIVSSASYFYTDIYTYSPSGKNIGNRYIDGYFPDIGPSLGLPDGSILQATNGRIYRCEGGYGRCTDFVYTAQFGAIRDMTQDSTGRTYLIEQSQYGDGFIRILDQNFNQIKSVEIRGYGTRFVKIGDDVLAISAELRDDAAPSDYSESYVLISATASAATTKRLGLPTAQLVVDQRGRFVIPVEAKYDAHGTAVFSGGVRVFDPADGSLLTIPTGYFPQNLVIGPDNRAFFAAGSDVGVLDLESGEVDVIDVPGSEPNTLVASSADANTAYFIFSPPSGYSYLYSVAHKVIIPVDPSPPPPATGGSGQPAPSLDFGTAPKSLEDIWNSLRGDTISQNGGVFVQPIKGYDWVSGKEQIRLVVYLGGTDFSDWQPFSDEAQSAPENILASLRILKADQVRAINKAKDQVNKYCESRGCDGVKEILLAGYSQGGIDAQNLAAASSNPLSGDLEWDPSLVTGVVTFGAPTVQGSRQGVATLRVRDVDDPVGNIPLNVPADLGAWLSNEWYSASSKQPWSIFSAASWGQGFVHGPKATYTTLSKNLDSGGLRSYTQFNSVLQRFISTNWF